MSIPISQFVPPPPPAPGVIPFLKMCVLCMCLETGNIPLGVGIVDDFSSCSLYLLFLLEGRSNWKLAEPKELALLLEPSLSPL